RPTSSPRPRVGETARGASIGGLAESTIPNDGMLAHGGNPTTTQIALLRPVPPGNVPESDQRNQPALGRRRATTGHGHRTGQHRGPRPNGPRQPAPGRQYRPRLHRQGPRPARPDRG